MIKDNIDIGLTWVYGTGNAITLPEFRQNAYYPTSNVWDVFPYARIYFLVIFKHFLEECRLMS